MKATPFATYQKSTIVDSIIKAAHPESIFLLGLKTQYIKAENIFGGTGNGSAYIADLWLLVLLNSFGNKSRQEWQEQIEAHCTVHIPVTTIVVEAPAFKEWIMHGDRFARQVWQQSECIYTLAGTTYPGMVAAEPAGIKETEAVLNAAINKAREFLAGAELYRVRKQYNLSAFMLHQSAEQSLLGLLFVSTGFRANTHNVERLLRYGGFLSGALSGLFLLHREEDKRLIRLLQKAYIDTRYGKDYSIRYNDLLQLTEKVRSIADKVSAAGKQIIHTLTLPIAQHEKQYE
ncbi:MAG: HEPN domain-containing protein [Chitinophagaceae bacterium]|nr:HEPN domain-containing protein [Chitinophagaceae bacterium]